MKDNKKKKRKINKRTMRRTKQFRKTMSLVLLVVLIVLIPMFYSLAKYVYNTFHEHYLSSKDFYFASDKLSINHSEYEVTNNWSGAETYVVTINMTSKENDMAYTESDIEYSIQCSCSSNIQCQLNKTSSTIVGRGNNGVNEDYFTVSINPANGTALNAGESVWVELTATSSSPYTQTLSGRLILEVESADISYEIVDSANSPYLTVNIINSQSVSSPVTLRYSPSNVLLDMTSRLYLNSTNHTTEQLNGYAYWNSVTATVDALSTTSVKFYKQDETQDYTYSSSSSATPIITLTY